MNEKRHRAEMELGYLSDQTEFQKEFITPSSQNQYNERIDKLYELFTERKGTENSTLLLEFINYLKSPSDKVNVNRVQGDLDKLVNKVRDFRAFVAVRVAQSRSLNVEQIKHANYDLIDISGFTPEQKLEAEINLRENGYQQNIDTGWYVKDANFVPEVKSPKPTPDDVELDSDDEKAIIQINYTIKTTFENSGYASDILNQVKSLRASKDILLSSVLDKGLSPLPDANTQLQGQGQEDPFGSIDKSINQNVDLLNKLQAQSADYLNTMSENFGKVQKVFVLMNKFARDNFSGITGYFSSYPPQFLQQKKLLGKIVQALFYDSKVTDVDYNFNAENSVIRSVRNKVLEKRNKILQKIKEQKAKRAELIAQKREELQQKITQDQIQQDQFQDQIKAKKKRLDAAIAQREASRDSLIKRLNEAVTVADLDAVIANSSTVNELDAKRQVLISQVKAEAQAFISEREAEKNRVVGQQARFELSSDLLSLEYKKADQALVIQERVQVMLDDRLSSLEQSGSKLGDSFNQISRLPESITRNDSEKDSMVLKFQDHHFLSALTSTNLIIPGLTIDYGIHLLGNVAYYTIKGVTLVGAGITDLVTLDGDLSASTAVWEADINDKILEFGNYLATLQTEETGNEILTAGGRLISCIPNLLGGILKGISSEPGTLAYGLGDSIKAVFSTRWSGIGFGSVFGINSEVYDKTNTWGEKIGSGAASIVNVLATFFSGGTVGATRLAASASRAVGVTARVSGLLGKIPVPRWAKGLGDLGMKGAKWLGGKGMDGATWLGNSKGGALVSDFASATGRFLSKSPFKLTGWKDWISKGRALEAKLIWEFNVPGPLVDLLVDAAIRTDATTRANLMLSLNEPSQAAKIAEILNNKVMLPEQKIAEVLQFAQEKSLDRSHVYTVKDGLQASFDSIKDSFREQDANFDLDNLVGDKVALLQQKREFALNKLGLDIKQLAKYFKHNIIPQEVDVFELIVLKAAQVLSKNPKFSIDGRRGLKSIIFTMLDSLKIRGEQAQQIAHLKRFFQTGYRGRINATGLANKLDDKTDTDSSSSSSSARSTTKSERTKSGPKGQRRKRRRLKFR